MGPETLVNLALDLALVATADALRDEPPAGARERLDAALRAYREASDAYAAGALAAVRERAQSRRAGPAKS